MKKTAIGSIPLLAVLLPLWSACGNVTPAGPANVPPDTKLMSLDAQQVGAVCDWVNAKIGGYGTSINCDGSKRPADKSKEACASGFMTGIMTRCPTMPVSIIFDCFNALASNFCVSEPPAACAAVDACGSSSSTVFDGGAHD